MSINIHLYNADNNTEIVSNKLTFVDSDNVIHVDRSRDEDTSNLPKNVFRVRSKH